MEAQNVGPEMNDFCKETQGRSKHLSTVLFIYTVKYYRHLTKKSVLEFATKLEQKARKNISFIKHPIFILKFSGEAQGVKATQI